MDGYRYACISEKLMRSRLVYMVIWKRKCLIRFLSIHKKPEKRLYEHDKKMISLQIYEISPK